MYRKLNPWWFSQTFTSRRRLVDPKTRSCGPAGWLAAAVSLLLPSSTVWTPMCRAGPDGQLVHVRTLCIRHTCRHGMDFRTQTNSIRRGGVWIDRVRKQRPRGRRKFAHFRSGTRMEYYKVIDVMSLCDEKFRRYFNTKANFSKKSRSWAGVRNFSENLALH